MNLIGECNGIRVFEESSGDGRWLRIVREYPEGHPKDGFEVILKEKIR